MPTYQPCPLCDLDAPFDAVRDPDGKLFTCPNCGSFFIDAFSASHIAGLPEVFRSEHRQLLQARAKSCQVHGFFVLREPRADEVSGDGVGVARTTMRIECLNRTPNS